MIKIEMAVSRDTVDNKLLTDEEQQLMSKSGAYDEIYI